MKKQPFYIKISHPDPEVQKQGEKALISFVKALGKLTGEKVKIKKVDMEEGCNCYVNHYGKLGVGIENRLDCPVHGE